MNKLLGALAISAVLTGSTYANPFSDVPAGHWAYGAVNSVVNSGMMKGYPKGIFKGKETVNRYQMATIISRLLKRSGGSNDADVRRTLDRLGEEFMDELDLIGARLTALEGAFNEHVNEGGDANGFNFSGEARVRWENRSEELTAANIAGGAKDDESRWQTRTLIDVKKSVDKADFFVQLQNNTTLGGNTNNVDVNQAWVSLAVTDDASLKLGRQAFERGNGSIISRYDHLQNPQSFEGWVFDSSYEDISYSVWSLRTNHQAGAGLDTDHHGLDLNFTDVYSGDLHLHYYHSTGLNLLGANDLGDSLDTYGFAWSRDYEDWDFYVQYAAQSGDNGAAAPVEYDGDMWNLAVGYDLDEDDKLGLSWATYSGNDAVAAGNDLNDEGWVNLAGDGHKFLGFADVFAQQNIEDITFTWDRKINDRNSFHLAYHMFKIENVDAAASYLGNGLVANEWAGVENAAALATADDDLGTELDLVWSHSLSNDVNLAFGYAMFEAGDYFTTNRAATAVAPDVNYAWVTATVKF